MPDLALDLRYLKYTIIVAEHGGFRRAANVLNLSRSTVSRRIQLLGFESRMSLTAAPAVILSVLVMVAFSPGNR